jgi:hypothetical protein
MLAARVYDNSNLRRPCRPIITFENGKRSVTARRISQWLAPSLG